MNLIILGEPGAGKNTLCDHLIKHLNYHMISPGDLLRSEAERGTELGLKAKSYWGSGLLCPDELINELVCQSYNSLLKGTKMIFNGYPRSIEQAVYLSNLCNDYCVVYISVDEDLAVKRLLNRGRVDDQENVIRTRFSQYQEKSKVVLDYYKHKKYVTVDGNRTPEEVYKEVVKLIC